MVTRTCLCQSIAAILFFIGAGLLTAGLVIVNSTLPNSVKQQVNDGKVLGLNSDGSLNSFTSSWVNNKYISTMQYWVFNYTNTIGIMNRAIYPDVMEKGPYAYDEIITMDRIKFSENGKFMQFRKVQTFVFNPNMSCKDCDPYKDRILIPDIGFQVGMAALDNQIEKIMQSDFAKAACKLIMEKRKISNPEKVCANLAVLIEAELGVLVSLFNVSPFTTVTVDQLLFSGYKTPFVEKFLDEAVKILHFIIDSEYTPLPNPPIQLNPTNGSSDTLYTVLTGKTDPSKTGYIVSFSALSNSSLNSTGDSLPNEWWPTANVTYCKNADHALRLAGTNADFFKNFISKTESLPAYIEDICRTVDLVYDRDVTVKGIDGYRFVMPPTQFDYQLSENCGFCVPLAMGSYEYPANSPCLPSGLLDTSNCMGGPIVMSKPHFYQADKVVKRFIPRFKSNYDTDETTIDIEPQTGTVLQAMNRLQINTLVNQFKHINSLSVMRPGAYPLAWINESFYMDLDTENQIKDQLIGPVNTATALCWAAVGLGSGLIAISLLMIVISLCCFKEDHKKVS